MKHQTPDSMKFQRLQRRLGESRRGVTGLLELLWIATQKNAPEGDIGRHDNEAIAIACDWEGDPDELIAALVATGWLDECDTHRLVVHDWEEHAPAWIRRQLKRHGKSFVTASSGQNVTRDGLEATNRTAGVTGDGLEATPNLTQPNLIEASASCPEPAEPDTGPPVMEFPTSGTRSKAWGLTTAKLDEYVEAFPGVDVIQELRAARQWCRDNPAKRKTPRGMAGFLSRWLAKSQNRGSPRTETLRKSRGQAATERFLARHESNGQHTSDGVELESALRIEGPRG